MKHPAELQTELNYQLFMMTTFIPVPVHTPVKITQTLINTWRYSVHNCTVYHIEVSELSALVLICYYENQQGFFFYLDPKPLYISLPSKQYIPQFILMN